MKTQYTYALLVVVVAAVSSGLTYQAFDFEQSAPTTTADKSGIYGHITATLYDEDGYVKAYRQTDNRIVDSGLDVLGDLVFNGLNVATNEAPISAMAVGTGGVISAVGDLDLTSRAGLVGACNNQTSTFSQGSTAAGQVNATTTDSFLGTNGCEGAINEAGLFDGTAGYPTDNLFARQSFGVINVGGSDQLDITWSISIVDDNNE